MDQLVRLYDLPARDTCAADLRANGIKIRRARSYEQVRILDWIEQCFGRDWRGECQVTFSREPVSTFIATYYGQLVGFASYEATLGNFFGPCGVVEEHQGKLIGSALLLECMHAMGDIGYAYAMLGNSNDRALAINKRVVNAMEIPNSKPGIYTDRLK